MTEQSPSQQSQDSQEHLEPPQKSVELEDAGAQDSAPNSDEEDHFSDATEGNTHSRTASVPRTRVEKVDDHPSHGDVPGTSAYQKRGQDSVPDEVEVIPEGSRSRSQSMAERQPAEAGEGGEGGEEAIPKTMVERVEPDRPRHGEVPGTAAYEQRRADAVPDMVTIAGGFPEDGPEEAEPATADTVPEVPETMVSKVERETPEQPDQPRAHRRHASDAVPDVVEGVPDAPEPTPDDDFDDFAEQDEFGDFDEPEAMAEPAPAPVPQPQPQPQPQPELAPILDFDTIETLSDLTDALDLTRLFPNSDTSKTTPPEPIDNASAIFHTDRSISLWSQLVAPPPLQPQNWVKSRIRRLFLVSLGVPVDLDEILPASKQKKLVLPSGAQSQAQQQPSANQTQPKEQPTQTTERIKNSTPPDMQLDLPALHRLCATTDAALDNLTDAELQAHVSDLQRASQRASAVLEYWTKRFDGLVGEKEAFEGVIENLVSHARRVRK